MAASAPTFGVVQINGINYIERWQVIPFQQTMSINGQVVAPVKLALPGNYDFRLKGLTRETTVAGVPTVARFLFKMGNSDGAIWYSQGGLGGTTDRVLDSLIFGTGQFPYAVIPPLFFGKSGAINMEFQDISNIATATPYVINIAFHGAYLIPA